MRIRYEERKKGTWTIIIDKGINPLTGKRERASRNVVGNKKDAEAVGKKLLLEFEKGAINITDATKMTLSNLLDKWLEVARLKIVTKTYRKYNQVIENRLKPNLGNMAISKLNTMHIQDYFNTLIENGERCDGRSGNVSAKTLKHYLSILKLALNYAVELQYINNNPAKAVKLPSATKKKFIALDEKQVETLLKLVKECRIRYSYDYYEAICLALGTGMRRNEILALRWEDIDLKNNKISVVQSLQYNNGEGYSFKEPKTENSVRNIKVDKEIIEMLKKLKVKQNTTRMLNADRWIENDLVFCHDNGEPWHQDAICGWFYKLLKRNSDKIPRIRFHDLRHTHATLLLKQGVNVKVVSERLGHATIRTTLDTYAHVLPDMQEEAVDKLSEIIKF